MSVFEKEELEFFSEGMLDPLNAWAEV